MSLSFIDTHAHLDGEEFRDDLDAVIKRAHEAGVDAVFVPSINTSSLTTVPEVCHRHAGFCFPMMGLQPEEVGKNWRDVLTMMKQSFDENLLLPENSPLRYIAVGECGLDFYWTREFEKEQLLAFEEQVKWSVEYKLPLMIHCRKAQNEMLHILKAYEKELPGGVFHCFTGNQKEAEAFLRFDKFCLGIGGVSTFKSSHLREDLPASVPLNRIV
ncbi:MAG: TatD family hydrolase, partial [Prevotellaceae bacterium]|nr:TatD family hydrolase [Prevotellaceae bacterium]